MKYPFSSALSVALLGLLVASSAAQASEKIAIRPAARPAMPRPRR